MFTFKAIKEVEGSGIRFGDQWVADVYPDPPRTEAEERTIDRRMDAAFARELRIAEEVEKEIRRPIKDEGRDKRKKTNKGREKKEDR